MAQANRRTLLAFFFMLLFIGTLGLRIWASSAATRFTGPEHIVADREQVFVHAGETLYRLAPDGRLLQQIPRAQSGLADTPIDMRLLADGRLLLAEQRPSIMRLCRPETWDCSRVATGLEPELLMQYKVLVDEPRDRLLVVSTHRGEIWQWPLTPGQEGAVLVPAGSLLQPNDLLLDGDLLWVADSGNRRLAAFSLAGGARNTPVIKLKANNSQVRGQHDWPMMLAPGPAGELWVVQPDARGEGADLLVYDPEQGATARIELPQEACPTDIARLGQRMLVTDMDRFRIYAVDGRNHAVSEFGDAAFQGIMQEERRTQLLYRQLEGVSLIAMLVFAVLMVLAAVWATPRDKRWTPDAAGVAPLAATGGSTPESAGVHWLERNPDTERWLRWLFPLSVLWVVVFFGMLFFMYALFPPSDPQDLDSIAAREGMRNMIVFALLAFSGLPLMVRFGLRRMQYRLGADRRFIYLRTPEGRELSVPPEQVLYSDHRLAWQKHFVDTQTGNRKALYREGEVETWLGPLLGRAGKLDQFGMLRHQWRQRDPLLLFLLVYVLVVVLAGIPTGVWSAMLNG